MSIDTTNLSLRHLIWEQWLRHWLLHCTACKFDTYSQTRLLDNFDICHIRLIHKLFCLEPTAYKFDLPQQICFSGFAISISTVFWGVISKVDGRWRAFLCCTSIGCDNFQYCSMSMTSLFWEISKQNILICDIYRPQICHLWFKGPTY